MSYKIKNDIYGQIQFIDSILPIYGIKNIIDYDTEIDCNSLKNTENFLEEINKFIPEIKNKFKTSSIGLKNVDSYSYSISLLKHLCRQARVLFDLTKYKNKITFALSPDNTYLKKYIDVTFNKNINKNEGLIRDIVKMDKISLENVIMTDRFPFSKNHELLELFCINVIKYSDIFIELAMDKNKQIYFSGLNLQKIIPEDNKITFGSLNTLDILECIENLKLYDMNGNILNINPEKINFVSEEKTIIIENYSLNKIINMNRTKTYVCVEILYKSKLPKEVYLFSKIRGYLLQPDLLKKFNIL